ncbi:acyltransferase [Paraglaciecola sp.]|uniref:acyltransferase family protein n=1 Tax=Paraglaciecola sp. TaxID=1920173 RepID=UPI00273F5BA1|nr:acyltransferase [Paraglaciecola sp.]MDP5031436.1 acyltransferase [Paraglaciecola sp.]
MDKPRSIPALTSIRGFAALIVLFMHIHETFRNDLPWFSIFKNGALGVDLFFVLSGFILAYVYADTTIERRNFLGFYNKFIKSRLARIYPLHFFTLLFTLCLVLVIPHFYERSPQFYTGLSFILNLFLIQNWGFIDISWNIVSWSISAEFFMYLLFPFMLYFKNLVNSQFKVLTLAIFIFIIHHIFIFTLNWTNYGGMSLGGMVRVFFEFSLGFLLFYLRAGFYTIFINFKDNLGLLLVLLLLISVFFKEVWLLFLPSVAFFILHLGVFDSSTSRFLSNKPLVYLGNISFSLYMWHWLVIQVYNALKTNVFQFDHSQTSEFIAACFLTIISLVIAHYSFRYLEEPARKWGRKFI